jgi:hypothetical protein
MMEPFRAFHLPRGIDPGPLVTRDGPLPFCYPEPVSGLVIEAGARAREAGARLARRSVLDIVEVVDAVASRLIDPGDVLGAEARRLLPAVSRMSRAMIEVVLDRMAVDWTAESLRRLLRAELGDAAVLDGFTHAGPGRRSRAYGPGLSFHVFAGNVPGVAVTSVVRALLVKSPVLAKTAATEPVLPVLFARAIAGIDPEMGDALAVTYWPGGTPEPETAALDAADVVVIYGDARTVKSLRSRTPPGRRLVVHGPRFSTGLIDGETLARDRLAMARDVAYAAAMFDQQGCVSPHDVWIEDPGHGTTGPFLDALAEAMAALEDQLPRGALRPEEAAAIHQERGRAELGGHGRGGRVVAGPGTRWTVVLDPDPVFRPSCLNRFIRVHPVDHLDVALRALAPHGALLQSVALEVAGPGRDRMAHELARIGATRVSTFRQLPWPPPEWHHDGAGPLRELLTWVDLEG